MIYEWVVETVRNSFSKFHEVLFIQWKRWDDFIIKHCIHEVADFIIMHTFANNILTGKVST